MKSSDVAYLCKIGFLVRDLDAAFQLWRAEKGVGPWFFLPEINEENYLLGQVTYFVRDIQTAMQHWISERKVGPWFPLRQVTPKDCIYRGRETSFQLLKAYANSQDSAEMQIELVQLNGGQASLLHELYDGQIDKVHNISCWYRQEKSTIDSKRERLMARGYQVVHSAHDGPFGTRVMYLEHESYPGVFIELAEATHASGAFFLSVLEAARQWDGVDPIRNAD